eukprot:1566723-Amphidinium_carterae.1
MITIIDRAITVCIWCRSDDDLAKVSGAEESRVKREALGRPSLAERASWKQRSGNRPLKLRMFTLSPVPKRFTEVTAPMQEQGSTSAAKHAYMLKYANPLFDVSLGTPMVPRCLLFRLPA